MRQIFECELVCVCVWGGPFHVPNVCRQYAFPQRVNCLKCYQASSHKDWQCGIPDYFQNLQMHQYNSSIVFLFFLSLSPILSHLPIVYLFAYINIYHVYGLLWSQEDNMKFSGVVVTESCLAQDTNTVNQSYEQNSGPLKEQGMLLSAAPSLRHLFFSFLIS